MPQTTVLPDWKATYPIDAPAMKPGGVVVSTTLIANAVPNKPQPYTATIHVMEAETEAMAEAENETAEAEEHETPHKTTKKKKGK